MNNLPPEILCEIASSLPLKSLIFLSRTGQFYSESLTREIDQRKKTLPWRISVEYSACGRYNSRVKVGWFSHDVDALHREKWEFPDSKLIVWEGRGGEIVRKILDEHPTLVVKIARNLLSPYPVDIQGTEDPREDSFDFDIADVEVGSLEPVPNLLRDRRVNSTRQTQTVRGNHKFMVYTQSRVKKKEKKREDLSFFPY